MTKRKVDAAHERHGPWVCGRRPHTGPRQRTRERVYLLPLCMQKKTVDLIFENRPKRTNEFQSNASATVRHSEWHSEHLSPCGSTVRFDSHARAAKRSAYGVRVRLGPKPKRYNDL
jgi:hypothetical protein